MAERKGLAEGWVIVGWATLALSVLTALLLAGYGTGEAGVRVMIRTTARTSVVLFIAAFVASSLLPLRPSPRTKWLLRNRRYVGVSFAVSHLFHLVFIVSGVRGGYLELAPVAVVGGGIAYVFIALMTATSSDAAVAWLGRPRWQRLHRIGAYYIWFIFLQSYAPRAIFESAAYAPVALLVVAGLVIRIAAWRRGSRHGAAVAAVAG